MVRFPSLSESSGFPTIPFQSTKGVFKKNVSISFREQWVSDTTSLLSTFFRDNTSFHLFQRVVGFRLCNRQNWFKRFSKEFPSLSESSGFPTTRVGGLCERRLGVSISFREQWVSDSGTKTLRNGYHPRCFHLFQRVVGFRPQDCFYLR